MIAEQVQAIELRDKWLIEKGLVLLETKTQIKKVVNVKKTLADKLLKAKKNANNKIKTQTLDLIRLATTNKKVEKIRTFKDILFNFIDSKKSLDNIISTFMLPLIPLLEKL